MGGGPGSGTLPALITSQRVFPFIVGARGALNGESHTHTSSYRQSSRFTGLADINVDALSRAVIVHSEPQVCGTSLAGPGALCSPLAPL